MTEPGDSVGRVIAEWGRVRPGLDVRPIAVVARIARLRALLQEATEATFAEHGLTGADFQLLVTLLRAGPPHRLTQRALGADLALTPGTISVRVDRLVAAGLVERTADPADGRAVGVRLTEEGRGRAEAAIPAHLATEEHLLRALTPRQRDDLAALLAVLLASLERDRGAGG